MKIFILLLALGLCLAAPGGYQQIDTAEAQADPVIQSYIQAGLDAVVSHAIKKGFFSNTDFTLTHINSVFEQVVNGVNYKFDCNFTDSQGVDIHATFTVHSASDKKITVSGFDYKVYYPPTTTVITTVTSANTTTSNTTVQTEEESVVEGESGETASAGEAAAVEEAAEEAATVITAEEANVEEAFSEPVVVSTPALPVEVSVEEAEVETTTPVASVEEAAAEAAVESPAEAAVEEAVAAPVESNEEESTAEAVAAPEENNEEESTAEAVAAPVENNEEESTAEAVAAPEENNEEESTAEAPEVASGDGFTAISAAEFAQNEDLQKNFQYGFQTVVQNGIAANKIPNTIFKSSKVLSASKKAVKNGFLYKFIAEASNGNNVELNLTFNVLYQVPSYSYTVKITTAAPSNNNTNTGGSNNNNTTTHPPTNNTGSSNNTNPTTPTTPSDVWVNIDVAQVKQNAEINKSLVEGFNQVIKTVIGKNKLKNDNYTISQVIAASRFNLTNGVNYKFTVKAQNVAGTTFLDVDYTTYYRYSNKSVKTVAYQYKSASAPVPTPTPTPAQNHTNTTAPTKNTTNTTAPIKNTTGYVDLSKKEIQAQDVQSALKYGAGQVVNIGKQQGKIPAGTYNLVEVGSVSKKVQPSGANYNCTVTLKSAANVTVNANFNVFSNTTSNAMNLQAYSYGVTGIKKN